MMRELRGRVAFVTGASSGIGRQLALDLAAEGMRLALVARSAEGLDETVRSCPPGAEILCLPCDVSSRDGVEAAAEKALARFGAVDLLVNNAGQSRYRSFLESEVEEFEELMRVNYLGMVYCTKALLPGMVERRSGHVVNVSSVAGRVGTVKHTAYCGSKFAVTGLSECLFYELEGTGVGITVVDPGVIDTNLWAHESFHDFPKRLMAMRISASQVSRAIVRAVKGGRFEIMVPSALWASVVFKAAAPPVFRWIQSRFLAAVK